ncbi:MAG: WecB/TagA/CpsF family glycosyltransferase [Leptolyngbyaceae cyanobacterium bins.302]|nr:WecB/TagA/CpsF family glycosyltransferase [Leptolyngbyaceae cyanobacterium bins.302]
MARYSLGSILLHEGLITESQLSVALEEQIRKSKLTGWQLLGEILIEAGLITRTDLQGALERQAKLYDLEFFNASPHRSTCSLRKRLTDIAGAIVGLSLMSILFPLIAIAIYLNSPGSIFVAQPRVGLRGKHFLLWRFRTTTPNAEKLRLKLAYEQSSKLFDPKNEPGITFIGRILRFLYLDEMPQFLNVLLGDMSLVGTRPPTLDEIQLYSRTDWQRLVVKPGLTGLWQIHRHKYSMSFEEVLELDFSYIDRWTHYQDLKLLVKTIFHMLSSPMRILHKPQASTAHNSQVGILNVSFDNMSILELLENLHQGVVFTPNVDHLMKLQKDSEFFETYLDADYRVCDSQILMYASRFLGTPLKEKISGSDLFPSFCRFHRNNEEMTVFLLGGAAGVADRARARINSKIGREIIIGSHSPSFGFEKNEQECLELIDMVNRSKATVLAVGVGAPKQEKWISKYRDKFTHVKIFLAVGATIDFEAGTVRRAPVWMSKFGIEWLYRIYADPKRLWKRYLVEDLPFFWLLIKQKLGQYHPPSFGSFKDFSSKTLTEKHDDATRHLIIEGERPQIEFTDKAEERF